MVNVRNMWDWYGRLSIWPCKLRDFISRIGKLYYQMLCTPFDLYYVQLLTPLLMNDCSPFLGRRPVVPVSLLGSYDLIRSIFENILEIRMSHWWRRWNY